MRIDDVAERFRNAQGTELKTAPYVSYTDLRITTSLKDHYGGACNGEVIGVSAVDDRQVLLLPAKGKVISIPLSNSLTLYIFLRYF